MHKVLNRGLKFAILPLKLDMTQVLTDFRKHERTIVWQEFWLGKDQDKPYKPQMLKVKKNNNFPRNYKSPKGIILQQSNPI